MAYIQKQKTTFVCYKCLSVNTQSSINNLLCVNCANQSTTVNITTFNPEKTIKQNRPVFTL